MHHPSGSCDRSTMRLPAIFLTALGYFFSTSCAMTPIRLPTICFPLSTSAL